MDAIIQHVALVSESQARYDWRFDAGCAALQKQASQRSGASWNTSATVDAFDKLEDVPIGYWPMIIKDNIDTPGAAGVHEDKDQQPFALISSSSELDVWSLTASQECQEIWSIRSAIVYLPRIRRNKARAVSVSVVTKSAPSEASDSPYRRTAFRFHDFYTRHYLRDPIKAPGVPLLLYEALITDSGRCSPAGTFVGRPTTTLVAGNLAR